MAGLPRARPGTGGARAAPVPPAADRRPRTARRRRMSLTA